MRKFILAVSIIVISLNCISCARGLTPYEAANGKAKCGRGYIK